MEFSKQFRAIALTAALPAILALPATSAAGAPFARKAYRVAKEACEQTLVEKHKALSLLDELARTEAGCVLRLARLESVLDTTGLTLRSVQIDATQTPAGDKTHRAYNQHHCAKMI